MEISNRLYYCLRCHQQVIICSDCDRGNVYCDADCAQAARAESMKAAGKRYQHSLAGRRNHAVRQQRYLDTKKKMTHQGSAPNVDTTHSLSVKSVTDKEDNRCHFCGERPTHFLRWGFLRHAPHGRQQNFKSLSQGP